MPKRLLIQPKAPLLKSILQDAAVLSSTQVEGLYGNYPVDTKEQLQASLAKAGEVANASLLTRSELKALHERLQTACTAFGVELSQDQQHAPVMEELTQDHYHIEGSMEEHTSKVGYAFRAWRREETTNYDYRYASILGVFDGKVCFYVGSWNDTAPEYYTVGYTTSSDTGAVTITGECETVDVKLVIAGLGISSSDGEEQTAMNKDEKTVTTQDAVPDESVIATEAAAATGVETSASHPAVGTTKKTDAESAGASVPDPSEEAAGANGVEYSGENGVGAAGDAGAADIVKPAMAKTEDGTKQGADVKVPMDADHLLQGAAYDHGNLALSFIQSKTTVDDDGKKLMKIQGIVTKGDIVNSKGEVYPTSVWTKNLQSMNTKAEAGKFLGKLEHPDMEQGLSDAAIKFDKFWMQGDSLWADATIIPTEPHGKNLQALIEAGVQVDFSSRGYGSKVVQSWQGTERPVIQDDFVCTAFDAVWYGASTGSGVKTVEYQSDNLKTSEGDKPVETTEVTTQTQSAAERAQALLSRADVSKTKQALLDQSNLAPMGQNAYKQALDKCDSLETLMAQSDAILPALQATFPVEEAAKVGLVQSETYQPQFFVKQSAEETAPQNLGELFDRLVQDLPDHYEGTAAVQGNIPNHFRSPRAACKRMMVNIAKENRGGFNGLQAAKGLLALEQGKKDVAENILTQSLATGSTVATGNADGDGAPLSNYLIFPLIRRVFPMYIMNEIASIQPMDRPEGKLFYLDNYRVSAEGTEQRIDLNTSSNPFSSSFADNAVEGSAARLIRLRLASMLISAHTKKLGAAWSIEEMQDLRAYHGLDAAQELLGGVAREMALEWNKEVLDDMLAQGTAGSLTFGTTKPSAGFDAQKDWDEYIWIYLQALDNAIFSKRNGPMTHIVAGVDAALAMAKSMRGAFTIGGGESNATEMEMYPGTTFFGTVATPNGSKYRVLKTNFWGTGTTNGSKIMGLRKGSEWSDTPYVWAPYTDYVTPMLTDPADFSQKQGIVSRAAKKVVVSDAIGSITVSATQGVVL